MSSCYAVYLKVIQYCMPSQINLKLIILYVNKNKFKKGGGRNSEKSNSWSRKNPPLCWDNLVSARPEAALKDFPVRNVYYVLLTA